MHVNVWVVLISILHSHTFNRTKAPSSPHCCWLRMWGCGSFHLLGSFHQFNGFPAMKKTMPFCAKRRLAISQTAEFACDLWLPIEQRIKYKTACLCYQIITGTAPQYLAELVQNHVPSRSLRSSSDDRNFHILTFKRKQHGGHSFCFSAAQTWNSLPFAL